MCLCGVGGPYSLHPDFLESQLTRTQILEWLALYRISPFGRKRDDQRSAAQTYWLLSGLLTEPPSDHSPAKYQLQYNDGPPLNAAEKALRKIRRLMSGLDSDSGNEE